MTNNYSQDIENLFAEWQALQQKESNYGASEIAKDSFTYDGVIDPPEYAKQDTKYLFISKESNIKNKNDQRPYRADGDIFWLRDVCFQKQKPKIFSKRLAMLANAIYSLDFESVNKCHDILNKVAFMNLNKRGGLSGSKWKTIQEYTKKYAGFIKREIDMIEPDIIICCGSGLKQLLEDNGVSSPQYTIIEVYHPSYRKSDKFHLERLKAAFDELSAEQKQLLSQNMR